MPKAPDSATLWNITLGAIATAIGAILWLGYEKLDDLEVIAIKIEATRFTDSDAADMEADMKAQADSIRADLTITLNEVDKQLSLLNNDAQWLQRWMSTFHNEVPHDESDHVAFKPDPDEPAEDVADLFAPPPPPEFAPAPQMSFPQQQRSIAPSPKYDLRSGAKKR